MPAKTIEAVFINRIFRRSYLYSSINSFRLSK